MSLSTHRLNTANPRRTRLDVLPAPRAATEQLPTALPEAAPTANPRRTVLPVAEED